MKIRNFAIILIIALIALLLWLHVPRTTNQVVQQPDTIETSQSNLPPKQPRNVAPAASNAPTPKSDFTAWNQNRRKQMEADREKGLDDWRTPIEFYGKVVDENTNPVADAQIAFGCNDLSPEGTSNYHTNSDGNGLFSIKDITGKLLNVNVTKTGYYASKQDNGYFTYAGANTNFVPDAREPVIFQLRKRTKGASLIHFHKSFRVPKDGTPIQIDLATGNQTASSQNAFEVACWTQDTGKKSGEKFDWKCQASVPGGGLQIYNEEFPFLAPQENYVAVDEINMPAKPDVYWTQDVKRSYFIRTGGGNYARMDFRMVAHGDHFCTIDSYLNPSGSQDLEPAN